LQKVECRNFENITPKCAIAFLAAFSKASKCFPKNNMPDVWYEFESEEVRASSRRHHVFRLLVVAPNIAVKYVDIDPLVSGVSQTGEYHQIFIPHAPNISAVSIYCGYGSGNRTLETRDGVCGAVIAHGTFVNIAGWQQCDLVGVQALVRASEPASPQNDWQAPFARIELTTRNCSLSYNRLGPG